MTPRKKGLTMMELIITLVVLAIITAVAQMSYRKTMERVKDREAMTNLALIQAAQQIYASENGGSFYPVGGSTNDLGKINKDLKLAITGTNWDYSVRSDDPVGMAIYPDGDSSWFRLWQINKIGDPSCLNGPCP